MAIIFVRFRVVSTIPENQTAGAR